MYCVIAPTLVPLTDGPNNFNGNNPHLISERLLRCYCLFLMKVKYIGRDGGVVIVEV